jgi:hypothetical protein
MASSSGASRFFPGESAAAQAKRPRVFHIAAIGPNFNRILYAVECRVALVFHHSNAEPVKFRLDPLTADESQAGPASIELFLHGRWRAACLAHLARDVLLRVECAYVTTAKDQELHTHQLELLDPFPGGENAANVSLLCLVPESGDVLRISYANIEKGLQSTLPAQMRPPSGNASAATLIDPAILRGNRPTARNVISPAGANAWSVSVTTPASLTGKRSGVPIPTPPVSLPIATHEHIDSAAPGRSPSGRGRGKKKFSVLASGSSSSRSNAGGYVPSIASIWNDVDADRAGNLGRKINVYGVVIEARSPCITRGPDLRSEVIIADQSSPSTSSTGGAFRTLALHRFEALPVDAIPFRAVGDVIRAHRVHIAVHDNQKARTRMIQGSGKFYSTYLLWAGDSDSPNPVATLNPVRTNSSSARPTAVEHIVDEMDLLRVNELRAWGAAFLRASTAVDRPFLKTVPEVLTMFADTSLRQPFDLICCFEGQPSGATGVRFMVSDGISHGTNPVPSSQLVEVLGSDVAKAVGDGVPFEEFAPSWNLRPDAIPMWVLIRDAYCTLSPTGSQVPVIRLLAGERTSTLIWLRSDSPEVRFVKRGRVLPANGSSGKRLATSAARGVNSLPCNAVVLSNREASAPGVGSNGLQPRNRPQIVVPSLSQIDRELEGTAQEATEIPDLQQSVSPEPVLRNDGDLVLSDPRASASEDKPVISKNANDDKPCTLIGVLRQKTLEVGSNSTSYRVRGRVCAWKYPLDLHYACKPWCNSCRAFLDEANRGFICPGCKYVFGSYQDTRLEWAFTVQLVLEDELGEKIDMWVSGPEASLFFQGAEPGNLRSPASGLTQNHLNSYARTLLNPRSAVDCSVRPYTFTDDRGVVQVACAVFATALEPPPGVGHFK